MTNQLKATSFALITTLFISSFIYVQFSFAEIDEGLMALYTFEMNTDDMSSNGNHGIENGDKHYVDGVIGKARMFDRVGGYEYILIPNTISEDEYTISFWVKLNSINSHHSLLMLNSTSSWGGSDLWIFTSHSRIAVIQEGEDLRYGRTSAIFQGSEELIEDTIYFITCSFKNGVLSIYLDSRLYAQYNNVKRINTNASKINIGISPNGTGKYQINGYIDQLRLYNRALSNNEIVALFDKGINSVVSGCIVLKGVGISNGKAMLIQSGEHHQSTFLDSRGCFKFGNVNEELPFSVILRRTME